MAANSKAIGLLFEVAGGGNINGETGKRINGQLRNLVGAINKSDTLKLKFTIDSNHFKKEIDLIKKQLQSINATSGNGGGGGASGGVSKHTEAWRNATAAMTEYYKLQTQVQQAMTRTNDIVANGDGTFSTHNQRWAELITQTNQAKAAFDTYNETSARANMTLEERVNIDNRVNDAEARLAINMKTFEATGQQAWSNLTAKVHDYIGRVEESANRDEQAKQKLQELREMANGTDWRGYDALKDKLGEVQTYINQNSLATETWYQKMLKTFGTRVRSLLAGLILAKVTTALRDIYNNVVEIDSAMTQLRIVTGASDAQMTKFLTNSTKLAKELGASIKDVLKSVETFSRLGYNLTDATTLSEYTTIMSKVAAVSTEDATKGITAIIKGYGFDPSQAEHIADVLINVGQKYAVSASELMEAYSRAGAALNATNTSFEKSAGLIAAANASIQDASVVGTALKTVSARIRKSKTDLDDLGESADDLAESWSVYAEEIEKLTGFNIMVDGSTTQFKDLYDIFDGLAKVWGNLGDEAETTQARVAEILGGTRQYQVISSILSNWGDAAGAYNDAMNSANVSSAAMATYMDSIDGRVGQLKATFEELSGDLLDSNLVKTIVSILDGVLSLADGFLKVTESIIGLNNALILLTATIAIIKYQSIITFFTKLIAPIKALIALVNTFRINMLLGAEAGMTFGQRVKFAFTQSSIGAKKFQVAATAVLVAITILVTAIRQYRQAQEEAIQTSISAAQAHLQEAEEAQKVSESVDDLIKQYKDLAEANNGVWDSKTVEQVKGIQDKIVDLVGDQASGIDLVNGKLQDEYDILEDIAKKQKDISIGEAQAALADAELAIQNAMNKWQIGRNATYELGLAALSGAPHTYGDIITEKVVESAMGAGTINYDAIKVKFDTAAEFARQYEAVQAYKKQLYTTFDETSASQRYFYEEINNFLSEYKEVYDAYHSADSLIQQIMESMNPDDDQEDPDDKIKGVKVALKSIGEILDETQSGFDGISKSLRELTEDGYLTADMLSSLVKLEADGALAGLSLKDILVQDANGFKIADDALQKYIDSLIAQYTITEAFDTLQDKKNAITNLENLRRVLYTLSKTQATSTDATKAQKKALEDQKDALKDQLDAYKKLVDLRKELLKQYEDELTYKKELAEKERRVSQLQTQLAVSQLDTSAAGRAKSRQLSKDLKEAQEELDDFTLEHEIDVVTNELDTQYAEYENYINGQIDGIEDKIDDLGSSTSSSISGAANSVATAAASAADKITEAISAIELAPIINVTAGGGGTSGGGSGYFEQAKAYIASHGLMHGDKGRWGQDPAFREILNQLTPEEFAALKGYTQGKAVYDANGRLIRYEKVAPTYHSGGIVGDMTRLKSTELFAKLLKGEFVSTPAQMKRFMEETLPKIANYSATGSSNEFNAPLIEITCESVTTEALPELEHIVNEAVKEIKRELDSGMSRTGFKRTPTKRLT